MVQLGLGSVHLGVGCNFVGIKVCLEFQNIFGPSTFTLLDRPLWHFLTVHFIASGPSTLTLSDRPLWHFWTVHFDPSIFPKDRPLLVEWPPTLTHDRPLWLKRPSTIVLDRPLWLKWPSSLAQDRPLLDGPSTFARPSTFTLLDRPLWTWLVQIRVRVYIGMNHHDYVILWWFILVTSIAFICRFMMF